MNKIPTPHIECSDPTQIATTVLMPGDPLRAKFLAENYLDNIIQFNAVRGMLGFTGSYQGKRVSVMGSGMGIPSALIYTHELFAFYGVEAIIRIGTCGALQPHLAVGDLVLATAACTSSSILDGLFGGVKFCPTPDFDLLTEAVNNAKQKGVTTHVGTALSHDGFYDHEPKIVMENLIKFGVLAVEMEAAGLYFKARQLAKRALAMFTVSDTSEEEASALDRQTAYRDMMEIALEIAVE